MTEEKSQAGVIRVGINGFGRIGRMVLRAILNNPKVECVAINDLLDVEYLAYMFKYDSTHGSYPGAVTWNKLPKEEAAGVGAAKGTITVDDVVMQIYAERDAINIPWGNHNVDVVIDSTGFYLQRSRAKRHMLDEEGNPRGSVRKVLLSAPPKADESDPEPIPMFVMGVNHSDYAGQNIFSNASCTTNCLAPAVKVLDQAFGIESGLMTTVHAVTATQKTVDAPSPKKWRSGRGAYQNIIPATTGGAKAVGKVYPAVNGKINGMAFRVPVPNGSVVDLTCVLGQAVTKDQLDDAFRTAAAGDNEYSTVDGSSVVGFTEDQIVSSDIIGNDRSSIYDSGASMVLGDSSQTVKVICWYDNEWGYSNRLVDLLVYSCSQE